MATYDESHCTRMGIYGLSVTRESDILPEGGYYPIFNIANGRVAITQIIGEVTVAIEDQANNTKLTATPTGGAAVDLCAVLDIADDAVGTLYGITGTPANAMTGSGLITKQATQIILGEGTIDINCAAENTGEVKWTVFYIAMDEGAVITAADVYTPTTEGA